MRPVCHIARTTALFALAAAALTTIQAAAQRPARAPAAQLASRIDSIMQAQIASGQVVGASIAVVRGRDTIAAKGYGKANLELGVATPPGAIYEIGSVTKQFTGAAVMQLVEQGRLSLDDDIGKWVPEFNTKGRKIPLRRLLDHTSGIRSYTEIPEARALFPLALPRDTLLRLIEKWPYDFEPGEEQIYNNSAFFLMGLVIEKASGMPYAAYVQQKLFAPAGMSASHYCSEVDVRPNKTSGYDWGSKGAIQKRAMSHVWPFAAGSLCSTAHDLVAWNEALHRTRKILGAAAYQEMLSPDTLNDGYRVGYAKGLAFPRVMGRKAIRHGGGINGWTSENLYFPNESLSIVVLYNVSGPRGPSEAAEAIAEAVLGAVPVPAVPVDGDVNRFAGTYAGRGRGGPQLLTVIVEKGVVSAQFRGARRALTYVGNNTFVWSGVRFVFRENVGIVSAVRVDGGSQNNVLQRK
ncbi:MAG: beta-lactamase family protein [Gemmatimonadaceae bacterium]|nr:beta-lactamase family protein [Gemmatimonadaceae bacterium]